MTDLIAHLKRREAELLETTNRYLMRAHAADEKVLILLGAIAKIIAIENDEYSGDWAEIDRARAIAIEAVVRSIGNFGYNGASQ